jgi:hypothetical protein
VAILDPVLAPPTQPRQPLHALLRVPHLDLLRVQPRLHPLADQTARHRVDIVLDMDGAARVYTHRPTLARLQTPSRQRPQQGQLLGQTLLPARVALPEQSAQELLIRRSAVEVPAATQQQRLFQRSLELVMALLCVPVLVGLPCLDRLALQAVVPQQRLVTIRERSTLCPRRHRCRQPIRAVQPRHAAQFPQGVLQPLAEALVALREAEGSRLPVRVRQHKVVNQMVEEHALEGHAQAAAVREIAGAQPAGVMHLGKEHFPGRPLQAAPALDAPLQRPQLAGGELAGEASLQVLQERLGLQARVEAEHLFQLRPDRSEGIRFGTPIPVHESDLAGQSTELAVLACRLGVEAGTGRRLLLADTLTLQKTELAHLQIADHREPPCHGVLDGVRLLADREI